MPLRVTNERYHTCTSHPQVPHLYESPKGTIPVRMSTHRYRTCTSHQQASCLHVCHQQVQCLYESLTVTIAYTSHHTGTMHVRVTNRYNAIYKSPTGTIRVRVTNRYNTCTESPTGTVPVRLTNRYPACTGHKQVP